MARITNISNTSDGATITFKCNKEEATDLGKFLYADIPLLNMGVSLDNCDTIFMVLREFINNAQCNPYTFSVDDFYIAKDNAHKICNMFIKNGLVDTRKL
jgi:hypothetical protein